MDIYYRASFFGAGIKEMCRIWLERDCKETPEQMASLLLEEYKNRDMLVEHSFDPYIEPEKENVITTYTMKINADAFGFIEEDWDEDPDHKYAYIKNTDELVMIQDFAFGKLLKPADYYKKGYIEPQRKILIEELEEIPSSKTTLW